MKIYNDFLISFRVLAMGRKGKPQIPLCVEGSRQSSPSQEWTRRCLPWNVTWPRETWYPPAVNSWQIKWLFVLSDEAQCFVRQYICIWVLIVGKCYQQSSEFPSSRQSAIFFLSISIKSVFLSKIRWMNSFVKKGKYFYNF